MQRSDTLRLGLLFFDLRNGAERFRDPGPLGYGPIPPSSSDEDECQISDHRGRWLSRLVPLSPRSPRDVSDVKPLLQYVVRHQLGELFEDPGLLRVFRADQHAMPFPSGSLGWFDQDHHHAAKQIDGQPAEHPFGEEAGAFFEVAGVMTIVSYQAAASVSGEPFVVEVENGFVM
jgi:hypothetical protein